MCGIVGKFNYLTDEPVNGELIRAMTDVIAHRGPDDSGVLIESGIGLGHRRLSIIDLSELGHQPMASADGQIHIVFNGEIYNFSDLRKMLENKGYVFKSHSDTEVIIYLYKEYKEKCLGFLRGMFAFAIWDKGENTVFIARDRIGKKPLYYHDNGKSLIFGSELKSILEDPTVKREIDYEAMYDYFKYLYVPDPKTIFKAIHKLKPGHFLKCSKQGIKIEEYWDISFSETLSGSLDQLADQLLCELRESVRLRMVSDVPLGAFLSGGIDSSGVVALMAAQMNAPVTTCTIGFNSDKFDEIEFARKVSDQFKTDHHEFTVDNNARQVLSILTNSFDEPFADSSAVPTYYVSKIARQKVTVALAGDGGDENFAGYAKYDIDAIENRLRSKIPSFLRRTCFPMISNLFSESGSSGLKKMSSLLNSLSHEPDYGFYITNTEIKDFLWRRLINGETARKINGYDPFELTGHYYHKADTDDHFSRVLYTDLKTYLPGDILVKVDRMSMANALEVRAPILDHKIIELAAKIPIHYKYDKGVKKQILKKAFEKILPSDILNRKKMGFSVPMADWFRGELKQISSELFFSTASGLGYFFNISEIKKIWEDHQRQKHNYGGVLWSLLMFELWHKRFFK